METHPERRGSDRRHDAGEIHQAERIMVFRAGDCVSMTASEKGAPLMLPGDETPEGPRYIWWNIIASLRERIEETALPPDDPPGVLPRNAVNLWADHEACLERWK